MNKLIVLDTSIFVNPASATAFGASPTAALVSFLERVEGEEGLEFFMPPSIYAELMHFANESAIPARLRVLIRQKAPKKHELRVPGFFLYELVEDMRDRVDRGLRVAERHVREAAGASPSKRQEPKDEKLKRPDAEAIASLRQTFRRIMREGMLDSRADVDLLLLAYEIDGTLVSADLGVLLWAEKLGLRTLPYDQFPAYLEEKSGRKKGV